MLNPTRLTIRGFRGFREQQSFDFATPATILSGGNHCGKSSTLNALEWCLFGDACKGKDTNIRERIGWVIANQHMSQADVLVELRLTDANGDRVVRRRLHQPLRKKTLVEDLELVGPDGEVVRGIEAESLLSQWLRSSFRDFSTTVYQHQELIRGIVTLEPKERNDAIDRLLGLSDYRNLLSGIADANAKGRQKDTGTKFDQFDQQVGLAVAMAERNLEDRRSAAESAGVSRVQQNEKTAVTLAGEANQKLQEFTAEIRVQLPPTVLPTRWQDLPGFEKFVQDQTKQLRGSLPDQKEQNELYQRQSAVTGRITDYDDSARRQSEISVEVRKLDTEHGGESGVASRIVEIDTNLDQLKAKQKEIAGRQQVIVEAVDYLQTIEADQRDRCPVCEAENKDLLPTLREKLQKNLKGSIEKVQSDIAELQTRRTNLKNAADEYERLDKELSRLVEARIPLLQKVSTLLDRELNQSDDPVALLRTEQGRIAERLRNLTAIIGARQERLTQIDNELAKVTSVRAVLDQAEKQKVIERIKESVEYDELNKERNQLAEFVNDVEAIQRAIAQVSRNEARDKLDAAQVAIDRFFRELTRNPAVKAIRIDLKEDTRGGRNAYNITDQDGQELTPILSQGDLNALALSMFLGLASAGGPTAPLGFVMLDDPSQSMGSEHKQSLAAVLDQVCQVRNVLLATMDGELCDCLDKGLTKAKTKYRFEGWTPSQGPSIRRL